MAIHSRSTGTLLRYTLKTIPAPVPISGDKNQDLRLELKVNGTPGRDAYCEKIQIRFPHGDASEALTETAPSEFYTGTEAATPPGIGGTWTRDKELIDGYAVFTFTPSPSRKPNFNGQNTITLVLSNFYVNKTLGTVPIEIIEWTSEINGNFTEKHLAEPFEVDKWPAEFTFQNLRPNRISVKRGEGVTLTWESSTEGTYRMHWDGDSQLVSGDQSWPSPPLEHTTGFMLTVTLAAGDRPLIYSMTTAVTVTEPNLEVGNLDVNGIVRLQGPRQRITPPSLTEGVKYFKAGTDGTLIGYLQGASDRPAATLAATVYRAGTTEFTLRFSSDNSAGAPTETPISIPVPEGAEARLFYTGQSGDTLELIWLPKGVGAFEEIAPPSLPAS
ncbi:hypothetical protein [Streptosporangium sp. NPDC000396]|uniref:hypothetical protein n=1 Tax=Streptosporangium sp. NPDC000396 TaxID=3366185 RepID=UPI003685EFC3